ncbi:hypothetical protein [Aquimarina sp. 2201CG14-23]|uniref:hypothetical protein n=1 Tax=Aquimarina mycalae TaxID=3040073 RepID=UPI002477FCDB|nr:hypothetical protein [Aquimarina sp. 2201CG14-23]MDH7445309.1 hypothetical protein [Aquimarina sp. 2201CG14-23]
METSLVSYNPIGKTFLAFEHSEQENAPIIIGIKVIQKKDELDVTQHFIKVHFSELTEVIKASGKAHLIITDSNILSKTVDFIGTDQEVLAKAYPNLDVDDFYYQILKTNTTSFVTVCRKQYVNEVIDKYKEANILITSIDLGSLKTTSLISYIQDTELQTYNTTITINNNQIASIQQGSDQIRNYKIDSVVIPSTHTLPFASILDTVIDQTSISGNIEEKNTELLHRYKESRFFKNTLQYGIGFLLISLLINFFVFNSKYKTWQGLQEEEQIYTTQKEHIEKQQSIVSTKEDIVNSIITTGFSKGSYYTDQIIQSQPSTVILKSFSYQPIAKTIRSDKPIIVRDKTIAISGDSSDKISFTNWIQKIESLHFVNHVTIVNYGLDKKNTSVFEIAINLIDDTKK